MYEQLITDWQLELRRLSKLDIQFKPKPSELISFILDCISYLKKYQSFVKMIKVDGMYGRHWSSINQQLKTSINPDTYPLIVLIAMELLQDDKMGVIKKESEQAQKEYAI
jgi:hypothetical protein